MAEDYGKIRGRVLDMIAKKIDSDSIFRKLTTDREEPRYDAVVSTLVAVEGARKTAKMLIDGLYVKALGNTIPIFKRNGVCANEILEMSSSYVLNNDIVIVALISAGADRNLLFNRLDDEMRRRHMYEIAV